jgi:hypothetical protein
MTKASATIVPGMSTAKHRLADEYDAAQERGEVAGHGGNRKINVPNGNVEATAADIGLSRKDIHQARCPWRARTRLGPRHPLRPHH